MKISTRGRYGLKAIVDIASQSNVSCINLKKISKRQGISENYLEQIIASLKKFGFVKSIRGAKGGYILNKPADEIYVGDILRVLEGPLYPVECLDESYNFSGNSSYCGNSDCTKCTTKLLWEKIYKSLSDIIDNITIQDIINDSKQNNIL